MADVFGPTVNGTATRPDCEGGTTELWARGESACGAGDGSSILASYNSLIANLRNVIREANDEPLIADCPNDAALVSAIVQLIAVAGNLPVCSGTGTSVLACVDGTYQLVDATTLVTNVLLSAPTVDSGNIARLGIQSGQIVKLAEITVNGVGM